MKYLHTMFLLTVFILNMTGQNIDQNKMDKDLEVAENILATLIKQSSNEQYVIVGRDRNVEGKYLSGYGVVLNVSTNGLKVLYGKINSDDKGSFTWSSDDQTDDKAMEGDMDTGLGDIFKSFLADYGNMIRQLEPNDRIMLKSENKRGSDRVFAMSGMHGKTMAGGSLTAEVLKSDLISYENDDLSHDELMEKIKISKTEIDYSKEPQLEVFSSMLERLYEVDLSDTYYMANTPQYERVDKFGVTYYLKYYSSTVHNDDDYSLPTIEKKHVSKAERDKLVEEMYPKFLEGLKTNILEYGHILKNIDSNEMIVLNVRLTTCKGCDMPASIELSVKKSVIENYRKDTISLEQAIAQVKVKDINS